MRLPCQAPIRLLARWAAGARVQVSGEEEIPEGAVAVLTPDAPDVLSHVSVRARNMRVLFATCHDSEPLDQIKVGLGRVSQTYAARPRPSQLKQLKQH